MAILAILISGAVSMLFFYKMFYEPTHRERNTALGIVLTEEGIQSEDTRQAVRQYRAILRRLLLASAGVIIIEAAAAVLSAEAGILLELYRLLLTGELLFWLQQSCQRRIIFLKYENHWLEETTKHMCHMKLHRNHYSRELVNDLAFVPVFLLSFRAFFYPGVKQYLQGSLLHGLVFVVPFVILLVILWIYYNGRLNRNLLFFFACTETAAMWMFQYKLIAVEAGFPASIAAYILTLTAGLLLLLPYMRGIAADKELAGKEFPERMPTDGEEAWLYGYYWNARDKSLWVKRKSGTGISLNYANSKARGMAAAGRLVLYSGMVLYIACLL